MESIEGMEGRIFTIIIDNDTIAELRQNAIARSEFLPSIIEKMTDVDLIEYSIPFFLKHIQEEV